MITTIHVRKNMSTPQACVVLAVHTESAFFDHHDAVTVPLLQQKLPG